MPNASSWIGSHLRLAIVIALLAVASVLPAGVLGWASALAGPVRAVVAPWEQTLYKAAAWARGRVRGSGLSETDQAVIDAMVRQRDEARFELAQANAQIVELRKRIVEISRGMELNNLPVLPVAAQVIGGGSDLASKALTIKAGRRQNIEPNNVAVVGGVHIVGLVTRVGERECTVLPITDRAAGLLEGRIMIGDTTPGPMCQLEPDGKGRLVGPVEDDPHFRDAAGRVTPINPGTLVRVYDRAWPLSAHGLVIGQVVKSQPMPSSPLRLEVTVAPIEPIERPTEVTIRTVAGGGEGAGGGDNKGGGAP